MLIRIGLKSDFYTPRCHLGFAFRDVLPETVQTSTQKNLPIMA